MAQRSKEVLDGARSVTFIKDREGTFARIPGGKSHLLVRSKTTRVLVGGGNLYEAVGAAPIAGTYSISLPADHRKERYKRDAQVELRFITCSLQCPATPKGKNNYPGSIEVSRVEVDETTPGMTRPIHWRLLTTRRVETCQQALLMVHWYGPPGGMRSSSSGC